MLLFSWDQAFQTGSAEVDSQHRQLINIINEFGELMERDSVGAEQIAQVCTRLVDYANYHFDAEERLMETSGLDDRHRYSHRVQHEELLYEAQLFRKVLAAGDHASSRIFFEFLTNWLVFHILGTDMLLARQIEAIEAGRSAAQAYCEVEQDSLNATALLLKAVKKLLYQISNRNRQLVELNESLEQKVRERTRDLSVANQRLKALASTDDLTGLLNRRAFMEEAGNLLQLARRYQHPLSLVIIDADYFKRINDTYGHQIGDRVLVQLSHTMQQCLRGTDKLGRIGGEEFAAILPETDLAQTVTLVERLLDAVRMTPIDAECETPLHITVSAGIASCTAQATDVDTLIRQADTALYEAKARGRNRWCSLP